MNFEEFLLDGELFVGNVVLCNVVSFLVLILFLSRHGLKENEE